MQSILSSTTINGSLYLNGNNISLLTLGSSVDNTNIGEIIVNDELQLNTPITIKKIKLNMDYYSIIDSIDVDDFYNNNIGNTSGCLLFCVTHQAIGTKRPVIIYTVGGNNCRYALLGLSGYTDDYSIDYVSQHFTQNSVKHITYLYQSDILIIKPTAGQIEIISYTNPPSNSFGSGVTSQNLGDLSTRVYNYNYYYYILYPISNRNSISNTIRFIFSNDNLYRLQYKTMDKALDYRPTIGPTPDTGL